MTIDISLAQFNRIATGDYIAGQIDIKTNNDGTAELVKINNHVWKTSKNNVQLAPARVLEIKEAFIAALVKGGVKQDAIKEIRRHLGIPTELTTDTSTDTLQTILKNRLKPLSRAEVRTILDKYAKSGLGFTWASRNAVEYDELMDAIKTSKASGRTIERRNTANPGDPLKHVSGFDYKITDAISLLSTNRPLSDLNAKRNSRITGGNAANERNMQKAELVASFSTLVTKSLALLSADARETDEFNLCGETVKLVKEDNGNVTAILGKGELATKVDLKCDAQSFTYHLLGRAIMDLETLGGVALKGILDKVYDKDLEGVMTVADRTSLTRQFAALVIAKRSGDVINMDDIVKGDYNTGLLVEIANRALETDGEPPVTKQDLDNLHAKLVRDNAGLDDEMKAMIMEVANMPIVKPDKNTEFIVQKPIVADINDIAKTIPTAPKGYMVASRDIDKDAVKNFVADLVFSDDTMVADVIVNKPGESMRNFLSTDERIIAFAEIIKNIDVLKTAAAPQLFDALKDGFNRLIDVMDVAFKAANNGKSIRDAAKEPGFVGKFSLFIKNSANLPGATLAQFDNVIQSMANKGCESMQAFINSVFQIDTENVKEHGALVSNPYKNMSADDIKKELQAKSLNQILDSASNADAPGQVGFFKQVMSEYFLKLAKADKRSCLAAALRYAQSFDFGDLQGKELDSAKKAALNQFTGAILKGTSPLLQKMMQGLPKEVMGGFSDALADMKSNLAPIPRKVVQAHLMKMINDSNGKIKSIDLQQSLGAASVGEAFLCKFTYVERTPMTKQNSIENIQNGGPAYVPVLDENGNQKYEEKLKSDNFVVKIMRHDAEARVQREAEIFTAAAKAIPGMEKTWEGQLKQYMTEFDFTTEAANAKAAEQLYEIKGDPNHSLKAIAPDLHSMKISDLVKPKKNVMVAHVANGSTVDSYFKENINEMRNAVTAIFEQDPASKRIRWVDGPEINPKTGKPIQIPVPKQNIPATALANVKGWVAYNYDSISKAQEKIIQATRVWFHEAILGSGKFHGDAHSGNLMVSGYDITFIDFGNLFQLQKRDKLDKDGNVVMNKETNQPEQIDERVELLRIIMGSSLRNKTFFLKGLENLLSPAGKQALAANYAKAEAILDAILPKGKFSYDVAYRLQAAVVELQKLGLELPPQINCFIQSMVRLQNTVSEMNTILNQAKALLDATNGLTRAPKVRDELDILGKVFDYACSPDGKKLVDNEDRLFNHRMEKITGFAKFMYSEEIGGRNLVHSDYYTRDGEYGKKVVARLAGSNDPIAEAGKLIDMLRANTDPENILADNANLSNLDKHFAKFKKDYAAADTPEKKTAAINQFADDYGGVIASLMCGIQNSELLIATTKIEPPHTFASAIMGTLFLNYGAVNTMMEQNFSDEERSKLRSDVLSIATGELEVSKASLVGSGLGSLFGIGKGPSPEELVINAIVKDTMKNAGDDSYQVDIGV